MEADENLVKTPMFTHLRRAAKGHPQLALESAALCSPGQLSPTMGSPWPVLAPKHLQGSTSPGVATVCVLELHGELDGVTKGQQEIHHGG